MIPKLQLARSWLGVMIMDLPRYSLALWGWGERYLSLCNRRERLDPAPDQSGYRCCWKWTSEMHAPMLMPMLARKLMSRALRDHPIQLRDAPVRQSATPQVSFIIGHRGDQRLPHLLKTLESIAGQRDVDIECLVVEQDVEARLIGRLPDWVRHFHTPPPVAEMPYCRSWALNVGARQARGEMLVLHDNDLMVSSDYAARSLSRIREGYEVVNLKRFGFYLNEPHTRALFDGRSVLIEYAPDAIMQNMMCGGSIAIDRLAYLRLGGMDEGFIGWGGEDNEFCERAETLRVWPYGFLPLVHLWHPAQPGKYELDNPTLTRYRMQSEITPALRIKRLSAIDFGASSGPYCGQ